MMRAIKFTSVVALLFTFTGFVRADESKGTIKTVDTGRHEVVLKGIVENTVYELNKDANVWLDGARSKLADLRADDRVVVIYEKKGEHLMVSTVRALRSTQEATGTIRDVVMEKKEVILKGVLKDTTYELTKGGTVWITGTQGNLKDLRNGDQVIITYEQRGEHMMAADVSVFKRK